MEIRAVVNYLGEPVELTIENRIIPVVTGFAENGAPQPIQQLTDQPLKQAIDCAHQRASWSSSLELRCPDCGAPMFMPPRLLAYLPNSTIAAMHMLWCAAGWPVWGPNGWLMTDAWTLHDHYLFYHCEGLPVRQNREAQYWDALLELAQ